MIKDGLDIIGQFIVDQLVKILDDQGHRASGQLQDTMRYQITETSGGFDISIYAKDYAKYVEQGVPPGTWVSVEKLAKWVNDKGIATGEIEVKNLAYAIQRKIFDKGTIQFREKKKGFVEVFIDEQAKAIFKMAVDLFAREVSTVLRNTIAKERTTFESI
jgi:hypothetical protein